LNQPLTVTANITIAKVIGQYENDIRACSIRLLANAFVSLQQNNDTNQKKTSYHKRPGHCIRFNLKNYSPLYSTKIVDFMIWAVLNWGSYFICLERQSCSIQGGDVLKPF
jgi:hypothetical protein